MPLKDAAIIGLGYVGLPLAVTMCEGGLSVIGFDLDAKRVGQLKQGTSYIDDVPDREVAPLVQSGQLAATTAPAALATAEAVVICVPSPLTTAGEPDLSFIEAAAGLIAQHLTPGQLIVLESTTYPGTTEEVLLPILSKGGLEVGRDFFLAFSPERVDPGNRRFTTRTTPKVVGGVTPACLERATAFYGRFIDTVVPVSSPRVAELTKVFENTFRAVNIALVNELAMLCDRMGLDVWEVVEAANTKPFGMMRFTPGPGVGGHCIPIDPFYLTWKAREFDFHTRFIELVREVNSAMPYFVKDKIQRALNQQKKALNGAKILVVGVAYKPDIGDWRASPALKIMHALEQEGAHIDYHDPFVPSLPFFGRTLSSVPLSQEGLASYDCLAIITDHSGLDYAWLVHNASLILDTRNACRHVLPTPPHLMRL